MPTFARFARYGEAGRELRLATRLLLQRPVFTTTAVATIALAIAANTLMFGIIRAVLLNPLPVPEPERLVRIEQVHHAGVSDVTAARSSICAREPGRSPRRPRSASPPQPSATATRRRSRRALR